MIDSHPGESAWGVSVTGAASVDAVPDLARVRISISETKPKPAEAFAVTRAAVNRVREVLRGHGVPDEAVTVSRLGLASAWEHGHPRIFLGYQCTAAFTVELHDLDLLETVLDDAVASGANQVDDVVFDVAAKEDLHARARVAAVAAARAKAEAYAEAAGVRLGPVVSIREVDPDAMPNYLRAGGGAGGSGARSLSSGKVAVRAVVAMGFALDAR
ncbi:SIMPL domain-containing protein [Yinghuangia soli]|uniref:SIMPL domain-containing protein n=1 Tax=Yinghuangia soli TaxID=2908204 RepID=A0AA41PYS6_9ACTN|nr:SIMPL domain-containing protein [Yinghuangia soli]MCF2528413.1 SIMPL domain-containing protein [Yinghuangia soli]